MVDPFITYYAVQPRYTVTASRQPDGILTLECNCAQGGLCSHEMDVLTGKSVSAGDPYIGDIRRGLPPSVVNALSAYANARDSYDRAALKDQMEKDLVRAGVVPARFSRPPEPGPDNTEN